MARAYAWSPPMIWLTILATVLAIAAQAVMVWIGLGPWWSLLWPLLFGYPVTLFGFFAGPRWAIKDPAKTWWMLADHRGKSVVLTVAQDEGTYAYYLAAQPKGQGLGQDLMQWVTRELDTVITGYAWPQTAERYTRWGAISHGRRPWRLTHRVKFRPPRSLTHSDPQGECPPTRPLRS